MDADARPRLDNGPSWYFTGEGDDERIVAGPCEPDPKWERRKARKMGRFEFIGNAPMFVPANQPQPDEPKFLTAYRALLKHDPRVQKHIDLIEESMRRKAFEREHADEIATKKAADQQVAVSASMAAATIAQMAKLGLLASPDAPSGTGADAPEHPIKRGPGRPPKVAEEV